MSELNTPSVPWLKPSIQFCTDQYPASERFSVWQDAYVGRFSNRQLARVPGDTIPFFRRTTSFALGAITFSCFEGSPLRSSRTRRHVADGNDDFVFHINRHGGMQMEGSTWVSAQHGAFLSSNACVSDITYNCSDRNYGSLYTLSIPRRLLLPLVQDADNCLLNCSNHQLPLLQSLSRCGQDILEGTVATSFTTPESLGDYMLDLVSMVVGPSRDAKAMANRRTVRTARLARLLAYVRHSFLSRELQLSDAANYLGTTERYVQQLLEQDGKTFTELVQESRLNAAASLLSLRSKRSHLIADIATQCGFNNVSYFNRMFKQRFDKTPREYRAQMAV